MTRQEIFDTVATALLKQGKPATNQREPHLAPACVYLTPDQSRCGVGWLFNDAELAKFGRFQGGVESILENDADLVLRPFFTEETEFLALIQGAHDGPATVFDGSRYVANTPEDWLRNFKQRMEYIAKDYNLNPASLYA